jgi:glutamate dehydrogenase (NADP+)
MAQNAMKLRWPVEEVDKRLHEIMKAIHESCVNNGKRIDGYIDYVKGANIAGFLKVANTMIDHGII